MSDKMNLMRNQNGSAYLLVLLSILMTLGAGLTFFQYLDGVQADTVRERSRLERDNVKNTVPLIFRSASDCLTSVLNVPIDSTKGNLKTELQKLINNPNAISRDDISIQYPGSAIAFLEKDAQFNSVRIEGVSVSGVKVIDPAVRSYRATVKIQFAPVMHSVKPVITMPMYLGADSAGLPNRCQFSEFVAVDQTLEDALCKALKGSTFVFDPVENRCKEV